MNIYNLLKGEITQKDLLNYFNATIIYETLPQKTYGCVFNYDGVYFILINKYLSYYKKKKAIIHELAHIELNQLCQSNNDMFAFYVNKYEDEADKYIRMILECIEKEKLIA